MVDASMIGVIQALYGVGENGGIPTPLVTDKTMTLENRAADAKSAGDAIRAVMNTANTLSARANVLSGSVSGASITATDSFAAPFFGLRVCGKSTQNGVPTPTAPVPIVSAGDGGTVVVTVSDGANKSQTLTLQTPNALPGIPVASSGNYTDESGQHWVCDEVDLARGMYVQRVAKFKLTSSMNWTKAGNNVDRYFCTFARINTAGVLCTHFSAAINGETVGDIATSNGNTIGFAYAEKGTTTVSDFKAFLDANDVYVWAALATPVETALSSAEIAAYKALTTYAPTTIISVSGSAEMIALYQRDENTVAKATGDALNSLQTAVNTLNGIMNDANGDIDDLQTAVDKLNAMSPQEKFSVARMTRTAGQAVNEEFWFFVNARWDETTARFKRINVHKNSFGIQFQAAGTYPGEETLGYNNNQSIGYWKANGKDVLLEAGDTATAELVTEDIGGYVGDVWRDFGVYLGWNNCFMLDAYGGMTIGGAGFEIDGNGISPFMRVTLSKREEVAGKGFAFCGLLWNAQHGFWNSDLKDIGDMSIGIKAPITYTYDGDYDASSNRANITDASFVVMRREPGADYNNNNMKPLYEFDKNGVLHVDKAKYYEVDATCFDSSSAQINYPEGINKTNIKIISAHGKQDGQRVDVVPLNVNPTDYGVLFNFSNGGAVDEMKVVVADKTKMCEIDLFALAKLLEEKTASEQNDTSTTDAQGTE